MCALRLNFDIFPNSHIFPYHDGEAVKIRSVLFIGINGGSGMVINTILSVTIFGILFIFDVPVIHIFNKEPELVQTATVALPLYALSFIPMAYNLIYTAFLFSTKRTGASNVNATTRGIVLKALAFSAFH